MKSHNLDYIKNLKKNEIFVFGSNMAGRHGLGAALTAMQLFGARYGVGRGLQGSSYALPTKDFEVNTLSLDEIEEEIRTFLIFANQRTDLTFLVSKVGCGLAGYNANQVAKLFANYVIPDNVILPLEFVNIINTCHNEWLTWK